MTPRIDFRVQDPLGMKLELRRDLRFSPQADGSYIVEDPLRGKFFRLGHAEYALASLLDGAKTVRDALSITAATPGAKCLSDQEALAVCRWLVESDLAHTDASRQAARLERAAATNECRQWFTRLNPLFVKLPLCDPDRQLTALCARVGWLVTWPAFFVYLSVICTGACIAWLHWGALGTSALIIFDSDNWLRLGAAWLLLKLAHETGHALVCKKFGGSVHRAGVALLMLAPVAYVDVTSAWRFRSKWQRIATAAAGIVIELVVASLAVMVWASTSEGLTHRLALDIAVIASVATLLVNANPLVRFDGYFMLSDLVGIPNLYSAGQHYVGHLFQKHFLGWEAATPKWNPHQAQFIKVYGLLALAWRLAFYAILVLALVGAWSYLGGLIAAAVLAIWFVVPAVQRVHKSLRQGAGANFRRAHLLRASLACGLVLLVGLAAIALPGRVQFPAVVDYANLQVVRAGAPGFVKQVLVKSGDTVQAGQALLELENDPLRAGLADVRLELKQSELRSRMLVHEQQLAKAQAEQAKHASLEKRLHETERRIADLTLRATVSGRIHGRNLEVLTGQYLEEGTEIAVIGCEDQKELVVAVPHHDAEVLQAQLGSQVEAIAAGHSLPSQLSKSNPSASLELPHPALSALVGGPVLVKARESKDHPGWELLSPAFSATAALSAADSMKLRAGQRATVRFWSQSQSLAGRWFRSLEHWMQEQMRKAKGA